MTTFELALGAMLVLTFITAIVVFSFPDFPDPPE
jgi:hypothetical protein